ncbi:MAG: hypothetical protein EPO13_09805 [Actinomycetota bacterium]|nr:MAG: hypothetical protein EPO13_09805 [Actinomycetota bacterium]
MVDSGHPGTVTRPPVTNAAARNGAALDRSGSTVRSSAARGPGWTRHVADRGSVVSASTSTPWSRSIATVIAMWGSEGTASPRCRTVTPSRNLAPTSSSAETN